MRFPMRMDSQMCIRDRLRCAMLNFFIGFAFFEAGAIFGFFVAALLNAAHAGQEDDHEEI